MAQRLRCAAEDGPVIVMERPSRHRVRQQLPPPEWGPPVEVDQIVSETIVLSREAVWAAVKAGRFEAFLLAQTHAEGILLDDSYRPILYLRNLVEALTLVQLERPEYLAAIVESHAARNPSMFVALPEPAPADDEVEEWRIRDEDDAAACGLSVREKPKRKRAAPTLPGCKGPMSDGSACHLLRRRGELYCPSHRALALKEMREQRAG